MNRIVRAALIGIAAVVSLAGCVRYDIVMNVSSDNTASGTVVQAVKKGAAEQADLGSDAELLTSVFGETPFDSHFTPSDYAEGDWVGTTYTFSHVPLDKLGDLSALFTVSRVGSQFIVDAVEPPLTADERSQLPADAEASLSLTFPLPVTEANGTVSGNTATWDLLAADAPLHAIGGAAEPSTLPSRRVIAIGSGLLIAGALIVVPALRNRSRRRSQEAADAAAAGSADDASAAAPAEARTPRKTGTASSATKGKRT